MIPKFYVLLYCAVRWLVKYIKLHQDKKVVIRVFFSGMIVIIIVVQENNFLQNLSLCCIYYGLYVYVPFQMFYTPAAFLFLP